MNDEKRPNGTNTMPRGLARMGQLILAIDAMPAPSHAVRKLRRRLMSKDRNGRLTEHIPRSLAKRLGLAKVRG